jgi:hypothetical protein
MPFNKSDNKSIYKSLLIIEYQPKYGTHLATDLTPAGFFLWPYLKNCTYKTPCENLEELQRKITEKVNEINKNQILLQNAISGVKRRARLCLEQNGEHFQHLL